MLRVYFVMGRGRRSVTPQLKVIHTLVIVWFCIKNLDFWSRSKV